MRTDPRVESPALADISDLKSPALFLLPLRGALLLQRLGWLFLRFLLPVHTLAHGSPPHDGERGDLKNSGVNLGAWPRKSQCPTLPAQGRMWNGHGIGTCKGMPPLTRRRSGSSAGIINAGEGGQETSSSARLAPRRPGVCV